MSDDIQIHYRACHLCEAICGLEIKTRGDQIVSIKGDEQDPLSRGYICPKATALEDIHVDPDRLRQPVQRVGDQWQPISWDAALDLVADKLVAIQQQHGANALGVYAGNPSVHNWGMMTHAGNLFKHLKTRNRFSATSVDQLPHQLMCYWMFGHQIMVPVPDIERTDLLIILGGNPMASNGSLWTVPGFRHRAKALQQRGGKLVVIDPRRSETADIADQHHFIRPGTDAFLLLAQVREIISNGWVNTGHLQANLTGLDAVKAAGNYAKVRTGGLKPEAIPSPEDVARFIIACADRSLAFKATAGLHHPIRKEQALTYESDSPRAIMHGFINVLMAAAFAYHGEKDLKVIAAIIDEREPSAFRFDHKAWWSDRCLTADQVKDARKHFVHSIGSCSFQEPVEDLQALGLLPLV